LPILENVLEKCIELYLYCESGDRDGFVASEKPANVVVVSKQYGDS
jgi:hypothetical protein